MFCCKNIGGGLSLFLEDYPGGFDATRHGLSDLRCNARDFTGWGLWPSNFLVKSQIASSSGGTGVVAVCNRWFGNVPQPTIWNFYRVTPGHATVFADGTTKIISPAEFATLDLSGFVPLSSLKNGEIKTAAAMQTDR